jgi:GAF domain-containing protein
MPQRLVLAVREFTSTLLNPFDLQELLHRLTEHAIALTGGQGAGIMLAGREGGQLGFAAASDERVLEVELRQGRISAGPCHEAFVANRLTAIADLHELDTWPEYRDQALALDLRAVLAVPMHAWGQTIGVLDIYREDPGPWSPADIEAAEILTAMGAGYVLHANQIQAQHELAEQLQTALTSRDLIGQAKGILMAHHKIDADEAFAMLRKASQDTNCKLREVARQLVEAEERATR